MRTPLSHFLLPASLVIVLSILGTSVIAAPIAPPPGGYTGGIFSYYFKNIIEGNGTVGTTSGGVCPVGRVISGFSTAPGTYGLPICSYPSSADGSASSLTGALRGTTNYVPKYGLSNTGIINSQIFDNGINVGIGTITPGASLDITGRTFKVSNLYPEYNWTFGGGTDLNWKKIADITMGGSAYAATSMRVSIIDAMSNYGHSQNMAPLNFYLSARRSGGVVNGLNDGLVAGPISDYVRLVKTGTGAYEVQARTIVNYRNVQVNAQVISSMDSIVTYATSPADGNTTGTIYTPVATNYEYFSNLTVSGSVGVGITSPTTKLQVVGGIRTLGGGTFAGANGYTFSSPGDTDGGMFSPADGTLVFATNNTERIRIANNGNVGIGTGVTTAARLTIDGQIKITGGSPGAGKMLVSDATGLASWSSSFGETDPKIGTLTTNYLPKWTGSTLGNSQIFDNGTNIGIGTSTGTAKLTVNVGNGGYLGIRNSGSIGSQIDLNSQGAYIVNNGGSNEILGLNTITGGHISFRVGGTERFRLHSTGNVGIGTAAPAARLAVIGATSDSTAAAFTAANTSGTTLITARNDGNIGIGTATPGQKLDVSGGSIRTTNQLISTLANGTAPLAVTSTTLNTNLNADLLDGLHLNSTTTNNEVNKIVRTDSSGFTNFGWINTTSGDAGTTAPTRIYGSYDSYIRYYTPTNFKTVLSLVDRSTGTVNYIPKWTPDGDTIGNSQIFDNGTNVGIGTSAPGAMLDVNGTTRLNTTVFGYNWTQSNGTIQQYKIATLPISTASTYDHIVLEGVFDDNWGSTNKSYYKILMSNRNGFSYKWDVMGDVKNNTKILAYQEADGSVSIWATLTGSTYSSMSLNITESLQAITYPSPTNAIPTGTLAFDSSSVTYKPQFIVNMAGNVGIGTSTPTQKLDVVGGDALINGVLIGKGGGNMVGNTAVGTDALLSNITGVTNTAVGYRAIYLNTTGLANTAVGMWSLRNNNTGSSNTAIGKQAGENLTSGDNNIALGANTNFTSSTGSNQLNIGNWIYGNNGNIGIGVSAPQTKLDINRTAAMPNAINSDASNYINTAGLRIATAFDGGGNALYMGTSDVANSMTAWMQVGHRNPAWASAASTSELILQPVGGNVGIGTVTPGVKLDVSGGSIRTTNQLISTLANGTAPLAVTSTTLNTNLNADMVDGYSFNQALLTTSGPTFANLLISSGDGRGVCFWGNCTLYKISMGNTAEYHYGPVTDYSIKNTMSGATTRGWTWGTNGSTPVAAINMTGNMQIAGQMTATQFNGTLNGNASTATALQTARTINGTSFNGTANITLPTVNTTGDQTIGGNKTFTGDIIVEGRIITDTLVNRTVQNLTVSGSLFPYATSSAKDIGATGNRWANLWLSGNATIGGTVTAPTFVGNLTGNASTATALQTARTINGTSFNGTANIELTRIGSKGTIAASTGRTVPDTGIYTYNTNGASLGTPTPGSYWSTIGWGRGTLGSAELAANWTSSGNELYFRSLRDTTDNWWDWKKIFHTGNDGAGSTLDADLLDGQQGSYYAPIASPALTGTPTAPTAASGTNTTQIATTAFVKSQGYLSGEVDPQVGTNTTNYLSKWNGSALVTSGIFDNGTNVGIGENNPDYRLTLTAPSVTGSQLNLRSSRSAILLGNTIGGIVFTSNDTNLTAPGLEVASIKAVAAIGHSAANLSTELVFNTTSGTGAVEAMRIREDGNVGIGVVNPLTRLDVLGDIRVDGLTIGKGSGSIISNTAIGRLVLAANTTGIANTGIGNTALDANTTGISNIAIGANSLTDNTIGNNNVGIGVGALGNNITGESNVALGTQSLTTHTVGTQNTALGYRAAWNQSAGDNNIAIGYNVSLPSLTSSNQLNIGNWIYGTGGNIGIGTGTNLTAKLTVEGKMKIVDGTQGGGKILTSDADGLASWSEAPADLPIGTVMAFNDVACPAGWAVADGTSGTPDLRGEFVRGLDMGRGIDTGRILGSSQSGTYTLQKVIEWAGNDVAQTTAVQYGLGLAYASADTEATASGINTPIGAKVPNGGTYTVGQSNNIALGGFYSTHASGEINGRWISYRPRNVALLYCMKMTTNASPGDPTTWQNLSGTSSGNVSLATTGNVGVGTNTPTEKLEVAGSIKIVDGNQGSGKVLVSDSVGKGTWQDMPGDLPIGTVMAFNDVACPSGWVIADGTSGTPDLRGEFVRGLDMGRGVDTGRVLGTAQEGSIYYGFPDATPAWSMTELSRNSLTTLGWEPITGSKAITYRNTGTASANTAYTLTGANAAMVRSRNVALLYCMKVTVAAPELSNNVTWMNVDGTSSGRVSLATTGNVGIGTATPTEKLEVAGNVKIIGNVEIIDGYQGAGKVLVSDNGGKGTWQEMPGDLPTGSIMAFNSESCPAGWVMADGTPGTPDLRGEFVRGLDMGRSIDTGRTLASAQDQDWKGFYMRNTVQNGTAYAHENVNMGKSTTAYVGNIFAGYWSSPSAAIGAKWDDTSEIRPRNVALLYCMKISASPATESNSGTWMNIDGTSSGRVILATTGNVGIGTVNPTSKFETTGGDFKMSDAGTIDTNAVRLFSSAGNLYLQNGGGNNIYFRSKTATNTMTLSNSGTLTVVGSIYANAFYYNSDIFLKKNIKKLESSLEKIQKLNGYSFDWKKTGKSDIGVIAQEVEKVFPALVGETTDESGEIRKTVQYGNLIAPIIEAIKELASQVKSLHTLIEEQQSEIRKLQTENAELRGRIEAIEKALSTNKQ